MTDRRIGLAPSIFDNLQKGSEAREAMFNRALQIDRGNPSYAANPSEILDISEAREVLSARVAPKRVVFIASAGLALAELSAIACGGGKAEGQSQRGVGIETVAPKPAEPTATVQVIPSATVTEVPKSVIPAKAQEFFDDINRIASLNSAQRAEMVNNFTNRDWPQANSERKKWIAYENLYGLLLGDYVMTNKTDVSIKGEMDKIENFMATAWPDFYKAAGGAFYRPGK